MCVSFIIKIKVSFSLCQYLMKFVLFYSYIDVKFQFSLKTNNINIT